MLAEIYDPRTKPFDDVDRLGVVIKKTDTGAHVGILYKHEESTALICHLAWHFVFKGSDQPDSSYFWLQSPLDEYNRRTIASAVHRLAERNFRYVPYSPRYAGGAYFAGDLQYLRSEAGEGLTCATFILSIYSLFAIELLDRSTWQPRETDSEFKMWVIETLKNHSSHKPGIAEHIKAIEEAPLEVRFRPEEVAAGAGSSSWPLSFDVAVEQGARILKEIDPAAEL